MMANWSNGARWSPKRTLLDSLIGEAAPPPLPAALAMSSPRPRKRPRPAPSENEGSFCTRTAPRIDDIPEWGADEKDGATRWELWIHEIHVCDTRAEKIGRLLPTRAIWSIDMAEARLESVGCVALCRGLKGHRWLSHLTIRRDALDADAAAAIAEVIIDPKCRITSLSLRDTFINSRGYHALAIALEYNTSVTALDLSKNEPIGVPASRALGSMFRVNDTLRAVRLEQTVHDVGGVTAIYEGLAENRSITNLSMEYCQPSMFSESAYDRGFLDIIRRNTTLRTLDISYCELKPTFWSGYQAAMECNTTLEMLRASDDSWPLRASSGLKNHLAIAVAVRNTRYHQRKEALENAFVLLEPYYASTPSIESPLSLLSAEILQHIIRFYTRIVPRKLIAYMPEIGPIGPP